MVIAQCGDQWCWPDICGSEGTNLESREGIDMEAKIGEWAPAQILGNDWSLLAHIVSEIPRPEPIVSVRVLKLGVAAGGGRRKGGGMIMNGLCFVGDW